MRDFGIFNYTNNYNVLDIYCINRSIIALRIVQPINCCSLGGL